MPKAPKVMFKALKIRHSFKDKERKGKRFCKVQVFIADAREKTTQGLAQPISLQDDTVPQTTSKGPPVLLGLSDHALIYKTGHERMVII